MIISGGRRRQQHQQAKDQRGQAGEALDQPLVVDLLRPHARRDPDDGGGGLQQLGVEGRHDRRHRRRQKIPAAYGGSTVIISVGIT